MLHRNLGCRMLHSVKISCLNRRTMRHGIGKVCTFFFCGDPEQTGTTVLYQCALERDLELFSAGDATEIGEKGITLR